MGNPQQDSFCEGNALHAIQAGWQDGGCGHVSVVCVRLTQHAVVRSTLSVLECGLSVSMSALVVSERLAQQVSGQVVLVSLWQQQQQTQRRQQQHREGQVRRQVVGEVSMYLLR